MVEQATHNRQATGSNPVGANRILERAKETITILAALAAVGACQHESALADEPKLPPGYTHQGLPTSDPDVQKNFVPLENDEFRFPSKHHGAGEPSASVLSLVNDLYPGKECMGCVAVKLRLRNDTSSPVIMDGDNVKASFSGSTLRAVGEIDLLKSSGSQVSARQKKELAAIAIGTIGFAEPIAQDMMTTSRTDWTKSYGDNEIRRKLEHVRFGKRILLPDEVLDTCVYFQPGSRTFEKLTIPLLTYPEERVSGVLTVTPPPSFP